MVPVIPKARNAARVNVVFPAPKVPYKAIVKPGESEAASACPK